MAQLLHEGRSRLNSLGSKPDRPEATPNKALLWVGHDDRLFPFPAIAAPADGWLGRLSKRHLPPTSAQAKWLLCGGNIAPENP